MPWWYLKLKIVQLKFSDLLCRGRLVMTSHAIKQNITIFGEAFK